LNWQLILFSSYELVLSLSFGLLTIYIATRFINLIFLKSAKATENYRSNVSTALFTAGMIACVLILVQGSVLPSVDALRTMVLGQETINLEILMISLGYFLAFYSMAMIMSMLLIFTSIHIHMFATVDVDEIAEIKANNLAQAILLTGVLLGMTYFMHEPLARFMFSLVDYDALETIQDEHSLEASEDDRFVSPPKKVNPDQ